MTVRRICAIVLFLGIWSGIAVAQSVAPLTVRSGEHAGFSRLVFEFGTAVGVPPDICAFHRYTRNSTLLYRTPVTAVSGGLSRLSLEFSHLTY